MADDVDEVVGFTDAPSADESRSLTEMGRELYGVTSDIANLEAQLEAKKARRKVLTDEELPAYMQKIGQDSVGLPEFGVDLQLENYTHANIAADWEPERRQAAFDWLEEHGHGDLVKTEFTILFPRFMLPAARWLAEHVRTLRPTIQIAEETIAGKGKNKVVTKKLVDREVEIPEAVVGLGVPWNTLTAWAKGQLKAGEELPLDVLGVTTGQIVKIVERDKPKKVK